MADQNVNPLYNLIADQKTNADAVKAAYQGQPTFTSNVNNSLMQDNTLNSSLGNYTDKVAELFAHDQYVAQNYADPTSQTFIENPYQRSLAGANLFAQKGKEVAGSLKLYETRKNLLGDLVDKAVKVYEAGIKGKEADYQASKDSFDQTLKALTLAETVRSNKAKEAIDAGKVEGTKDLNTIAGWADIVETNGRQVLSQIPKELRSSVVEYLANKKVPILDSTTLTKKKAYDNAISYIDRALAILNEPANQKKDLSGGLSGWGPIRSTKNAFGLLPEESTLLENLVSKIASGDAFEEAGKALTGTELDIVGGKIPTMKLDEKVLKQRLEEARKTAEMKKKNILGTYAEQAAKDGIQVGDFTVKVKQ